VTETIQALFGTARPTSELISGVPRLSGLSPEPEALAVVSPGSTAILMLGRRYLLVCGYPNGLAEAVILMQDACSWLTVQGCGGNS
jgi:hypothetical protein